MHDPVEALRERGIQPSAQRVAIARYVLDTRDHPSADQVWSRVRAGFPMLSRATVYNTLGLFVRKGLLRQLTLAEGNVVFDPNLMPHHHFIDLHSGAIYDLPWNSFRVRQVGALKGFEINEYQVVIRGRRRRSGRGKGE
jgi:Fur family transcriptional regulator, iron response regulator